MEFQRPTRGEKNSCSERALANNRLQLDRGPLADLLKLNGYGGAAAAEAGPLGIRATTAQQEEASHKNMPSMWSTYFVLAP